MVYLPYADDIRQPESDTSYVGKQVPPCRNPSCHCLFTGRHIWYSCL
jgi:hypothetical protein